MSVGAPHSKGTTRWRLAVFLVALLLVGPLMMMLGLLLAWPSAPPGVRARVHRAAARSVAGPRGAAPSAGGDGETGLAFAPAIATLRCPVPSGEGAQYVVVETVGPPERMYTAQGKDGAFDLPVFEPAGVGTIKVEGYAHMPFRWHEGTCISTEEWRPTDRGIIIGTVAEADGPLPQNVRVDGCGSSGPVDENGAFRLEAMDDEPCDLHVSHRRGHMVVEGESLRIDPSEAVTDIELPLDPSRINLRGFHGIKGDLGAPTLLVELALEPRGLRVIYTSLYTIALDGALSNEEATDPPPGALITAVDGVSTATTADAQVELAERLLAAGTAYTLECRGAELRNVRGQVREGEWSLGHDDFDPYPLLPLGFGLLDRPCPRCATRSWQQHPVVEVLMWVELGVEVVLLTAIGSACATGGLGCCVAGAGLVVFYPPWLVAFRTAQHHFSDPCSVCGFERSGQLRK